MATRQTLDDSIGATLEWLDEALLGNPSRVSQHAAGKERFADLAASQLLIPIPAELRTPLGVRPFAWSIGARRTCSAGFGAFVKADGLKERSPVAERDFIACRPM